MRAKQPVPILIHSGYGASVFYRPPDQTIDVFLWLNCAKRRPHAFRIPGDQDQLIYDPVVLAAVPKKRQIPLTVIYSYFMMDILDMITVPPAVCRSMQLS